MRNAIEWNHLNYLNLALWIYYGRKDKTKIKPWSFRSATVVHAEDEHRFSKENEILAFFFLWHTSVNWTCSVFDLKCFLFLRLKTYNKHLISLVFSVRTVSASNGSSFFPLDLWPKRKAVLSGPPAVNSLYSLHFRRVFLGFNFDYQLLQSSFPCRRTYLKF